MSCACPESPSEVCDWCLARVSPGARRRWEEARSKALWEGTSWKPGAPRFKPAYLRGLLSAKAKVQEEAKTHTEKGKSCDR